MLALTKKREGCKPGRGLGRVLRPKENLSEPGGAGCLLLLAFQAAVMQVSLKGRKERVIAWSDQTSSDSSGEVSKGFKQRHELGLNISLETYHSSSNVEDKLDCNKIGGQKTS